MTNRGKKYKDRHTDKRRVVYWLQRHKDQLISVVSKLNKKVKK